jgi:nucleoside triphosphate diphosphatase
MSAEAVMTRYSLDDLIFLMQCLRDPQGGCPWDLKQTYQTVVPSTLEEAYEVADAIEQGNMVQLKEELGDLLFQTIFYSQLAAEDHQFNFYDVVHGLVDKLIRRHPHVFPQGILVQPSPNKVSETLDVKLQWEKIKESERVNKGKSRPLDDIPLALPSLTRAQKIQKRLQSQETPPMLIQQLQSRLAEWSKCTTEQLLTTDVGELLFLTAKLARSVGADAETALRHYNQAYIQRFDDLEATP